jgi:hypothetical protein
MGKWLKLYAKAQIPPKRPPNPVRCADIFHHMLIIVTIKRATSAPMHITRRKVGISSKACRK